MRGDIDLQKEIPPRAAGRGDAAFFLQPQFFAGLNPLGDLDADILGGPVGAQGDVAFGPVHDIFQAHGYLVSQILTLGWLGAIAGAAAAAHVLPEKREPAAVPAHAGAKVDILLSPTEVELPQDVIDIEIAENILLRIPLVKLR